MQGVFFRAGTRAEAERLGVTGWARNLPDGSVDVLACGPPEAVEALVAWLWQGPRMATVERVDCEEADEEPPQRFDIG